MAVHLKTRDINYSQKTASILVSHCLGWHGCQACQKLMAARKRHSGNAQRCQGTAAGKENGAACPTACDHNEEENSHSCFQINVTTTMCFCPNFSSSHLYYSKLPFPFSTISGASSAMLSCTFLLGLIISCGILHRHLCMFF